MHIPALARGGLEPLRYHGCRIPTVWARVSWASSAQTWSRCQSHAFSRHRKDPAPFTCCLVGPSVLFLALCSRKPTESWLHVLTSVICVKDFSSQCQLLHSLPSLPRTHMLAPESCTVHLLWMRGFLGRLQSHQPQACLISGPETAEYQAKTCLIEPTPALYQP